MNHLRLRCQCIQRLNFLRGSDLNLRDPSEAGGNLVSIALHDPLYERHGRFLTDAEMAGGSDVVVISNRLATELAAGRDVSAIVGTSFTLQGHEWRIVGVLAAFAGERLFGAMVPFATAPATSGSVFRSS